MKLSLLFVSLGMCLFYQAYFKNHIRLMIK